jgi:hypothetical protein
MGKPHHTSPPVTEHALSSLSDAYGQAGLGPEDLDYYSTSDWFENLAANCLQPAERAVVFACGEVVLPMRIGQAALGPLRGVAARGLSNFYSCRFTPPGLEPSAHASGRVAAIGRHLRQQGIATLWFDALDERPKDLMVEGLEQAGWLVEPFAQFGNWHLDVRELDFETYWRNRPGALRNTGQRRYRALIERGDGRAVCFAAPDEAEAAIAAYEGVYARSWQPAEPFPGYMPGLIRRGLAAGEVQVWSLFVGKQPVAAQVWVRRHSQATIFKLAYDQDWGKQSVGTVLTMAAMQPALGDASIEEIDLGWGDDDYKQQWLPDRRQRYGIAAYNPRSLVGLAKAARRMLPRKLKALVSGMGSR